MGISLFLSGREQSRTTKPYFWGDSHCGQLKRSQSPTWPQHPGGAEVPSPLRAGGIASEKEPVEELVNMILSPKPITQNYIVLNSFAL